MEIKIPNVKEEDAKRLADLIGPQRQLFASTYVETKDIEKAAQAASYTLEEAKQFLIDKPRWLRAALRTLQREETLDLGEDVIKETLLLDPVDEDGKLDINVQRLKLDAAKYATSTLGNEIYNTKTKNESTQTNVNIFQVLERINSGKPIDNPQREYVTLNPDPIQDANT